jgi:ankyrin repeat protein
LDELDEIRQHAALKVAECYLISFGTEYDSVEVLRWLKIAESYQWRIGLCLDRISEALGYPLEVPRRPETQLIENSEDNESKGSAASELYLMEKIQSAVASVVNQIQELMLQHLQSRHFEMAVSSLLYLETGLINDSNMTALDIAALLGDNEYVLRLLLTADSAGNHEQRLNAVHYACIGGNLSTLKLVLDQGVDPLLHGPNNVTALHFLIFMPADVVGSALDLLIAHGALTDIQSEPIHLADTDLRLVGMPLEWAVIARNRALVDALLPHSKGQEGSVLRLAIKHAYYEIAADLFSNDAFRNVVTSDDCPLFLVDRPFSHLIVHGRDGDLAIERTIRLCNKYGLINYETKLRQSISLARTQSCLKSIEMLLDLCPPAAIKYGFDTEDVRLRSTLFVSAGSSAVSQTRE